jgi:hypothetical protein
MGEGYGSATTEEKYEERLKDGPDFEGFERK